jgi:hypothetical protein
MTTCSPRATRRSPSSAKRTECHAEDPVGPDNDAYVQIQSGLADVVVLAWGTHGNFLGRDQDVIGNLKVGCPGKLRHLGLTKAGHPKHPLYLKADTPLEAWS